VKIGRRGESGRKRRCSASWASPIKAGEIQAAGEDAPAPICNKDVGCDA
jgi:hypothetical protein